MLRTTHARLYNGGRGRPEAPPNVKEEQLGAPAQGGGKPHSPPHQVISVRATISHVAAMGSLAREGSHWQAPVGASAVGT